jgi:hypothetical protein
MARWPLQRKTDAENLSKPVFALINKRGVVLMNNLRTALLLGALTGLLMLLGGYFGGKQGIVIAFLFAMVMNFGSYWFSHKIVLKMYRAREITEAEAPELYSTVKNLALRAGLPMPKVCIVPGETPNAFATGRDEHHAVVAVTEGILRLLDRDELEGVLSHELTHIKNKDMLIGSIAATIAGAIMMLALRTCQCPGEDVPGIRGDSHEGKSLDGAYVYRESSERKITGDAFQHPPADRKEDRKAQEYAVILLISKHSDL